MKAYFIKIKRLVINRLFNPIVYRSEKNEKIAKKYILNKPLFKYKKLWVNGFNTNKKVVHIKKQEQLFDLVCGWLSLNRDVVYLCNSNIEINPKLFNCEFELITTDKEWSVLEIYENINQDSNIKDFRNDNKITYCWIAKPGFSKFNQITKTSKLSTNYRLSDFDYFLVE